MAVSASHSALPYPIKGARFTLLVPFINSSGDPTDPTTPDTEVSQDGGAFADAAEEITTISGSNGMGYLTLTGAETNNSQVGLAFKAASGPKTSLGTLYPRVLAQVGTGTLSAGSSSGGTLGTLLAYDVTGCFIKTTGGTGGGGTGGANNQARKIVTYNTGTGAFTVAPNWETTPDSTTTYEVLLPEGVTLGMLRALNPVSPGAKLVVDAAGLADANVVKLGPSGSGTAQTARDIGASVLLSSGTGTGQVKLSSGYVAPNWGDVGNPTTSVNLSGTTVGTTTTVTNQVTANMTAISGDTVAADNLEAEYDGTGYKDYLRRSTAQAGGASTITLDSGASSTNDLYKGLLVAIVSGTGAGQTRAITGYVGSTKVATVHVAWATNPSSDSVFQILPFPEVAQAPPNFSSLAVSGSGVVDANAVQLSGDATAADNLEAATDGTGYNVGGGQIVAASVAGAVGSVAAGGITSGSFATGAITAAAIAADAIGAAELAADAVTEIQSGLATSSALATVGNNVSSVKTVTDKLNTTLEADSPNYRFTEAALLNAPTGGGGGSGTGDYARLFRLVRPGSAAPLPNRKVTIYDSTQTTIIASWFTDASGEVTFNLNADTYLVLIGANAADVPIAAQSLTVSAAGTTQYTVTAASASGGTDIL